MIPENTTKLGTGFHDVPPQHLAAVVTALEMHEQVSLTADLPDEFSLTKTHSISLQNYRDLFKKIGGPWLWSSRLQLADQELSKILHAATTEIWLLKDMQKNQTAGFFELDYAKPGQCEISLFGLDIAYGGRGLGKAMMARLFEMVWANHSIRRLWVHTCTLDDPSALPFYMKCGFRPFRRLVEVFEDPRSQGLADAYSAAKEPEL